MIPLILVFCLVVGGLLILSSAIGRPVPPALRCRRCGYEVAGLPESDPCPECGRAKRGKARMVRRKHSRLKFILGLLVASPGFAAILLVSVSIPTAYLLFELEHDVLIGRDHAFYSIDERLEDRVLTPAQVEAAVDAIIQVQSDPHAPWSEIWGEFVVKAHEQGLISQAHWDRYVAGTVSLDLQYDGAGPPGYPPAIRPVLIIRGDWNREYLCLVRHEGTTINGMRHWIDSPDILLSRHNTRWLRPHNWLRNGRFFDPEHITFESVTDAADSEVAITEPGEVTVTSEWTVRILNIESDDRPKDIVSSPFLGEQAVETFESMTSDPKFDPPQTTTISATRVFHVEPRTDDDVEWVNDPETRERISRYIKTTLSDRWAWWEDPNRPGQAEPEPGLAGKCDFFFTVHGRSPDGEDVCLGAIWQRSSGDGFEFDRADYIERLYMVSSGPSHLTCDLVLRPNKVVPHYWQGEAPFWSEEIRLDNVQLQYRMISEDAVYISDDEDDE